MGFLTRRKFKNSVSYPSTSAGGIPFFSTIIGGQTVNYVSGAAALRNSDIFSVINRISSDIAAAKFKTENTRVVDILNRPSSILGRFSFWQGVITQLLLDGNAYVIIGDNLEQRMPSEVNIGYDSANQKMQYRIIEFDNEKEKILSDNQILHFRIMPDSQYHYLIGRSPLESLTDDLTIAQNSKKAMLNSVNHQIYPMSILNVQAEQLSNEDRETARQEFERANGGSNTGRLMVFDKNTTFQQSEIKADVFTALNSGAQYSAGQVAKAFGIPVDIMGGGADTESQHSNIQQVLTTYVANLNAYIVPIVDEIALKMNAPDLKLDVKGALDADDSLIISQVANLTSSGVITRPQGFKWLQANGVIPMNIPDAEKGSDEDESD
ncbi:phage portal protein [Lactobacillus sp. ESL0677]|uniref:phage portal protein n=1 Tax=Lactobacillus sp. ESL0677 TaxID=2983208 RepID=UPI0023F8B1C6|nr:phage portal protein [Lactobacillus sp. ESL0677]WEV36222.1 phage portal protein [Lactobacillus sp. ESL0677]